MSLVRLARIALAAACLHVAAVRGGEAAGPSAPAQPPAQRQALISISEETTRVVRPLDDEGYVDYVAALNERCSRGVTPENNAVVPLRRAFGPGTVEPTVGERYYGLLGIPPGPEDGDYFVPWDDYLEDRGLDWTEKLGNEFYGSADGPWAPADRPTVAGWLKANEKPLDLVVEASRRPGWFEPLVSHDKDVTLLSAFLAVGLRVDKAGEALAARAMQRLGAADADAAVSDLLACHRLARLVGQGPRLFQDDTAAFALEYHAFRADTALAVSGELTARSAAAYLAELDRLPPLPHVVDNVDKAGRYMCLDGVASVARAVEQAQRESLESDFENLVFYLMPGLWDWNEILRMCNGWYDRLVVAGRKPALSERLDASAQWCAEVEQFCEEAGDKKQILLDLLCGKSPRSVMSKCTVAMILGPCMPTLSLGIKAEERASVCFQISRVALALAAYHAEHGKYPAALAALKPKHLDEIPRDRFADAELTYRRTDEGYVLYSVGPNGRDDGGRGRDDPQPEDAEYQDWDDIAVRK